MSASMDGKAPPPSIVFQALIMMSGMSSCRTARGLAQCPRPISMGVISRVGNFAGIHRLLLLKCRGVAIESHSGTMLDLTKWVNVGIKI